MSYTQMRMVAVDMDGTLLGADGHVSARNLAALKAAERAGVEVVVATGRRHSFAMRVLRGLGLREENGLISSNGAVVRTLGAPAAGTDLAGAIDRGVAGETYGRVSALAADYL